MKEAVQKCLSYLISMYLRQEESQLVLPKVLILILRIQQALISLTYVYGTSEYYYIDLVSKFTRPQQFLPIYEVTQYVVLLISIAYILTIFSIIPQHKCLSIFGQLLRSSAINFFFEMSQGQIQTVTHSFLVLISLTETIVVQGTLDVATKNFQNTRYTFFDFLGVLLNYFIMISYTYQFSYRIIMIIAIILNIVRILNQLFFSSFNNYQTKTIMLTLKIASLLLISFWVFNIQLQVSAYIVILPLIFQVIQMHYKVQLDTIIHLSKQNKPCNILKLIAFSSNIQNIEEIIVRRPKNARDKIIYCSLLMVQNRNYEAFHQLQQIPDSELNVLEIFKKKLIVKKCLNKIQQRILSCQQQKTHRIANAIESLMASEQANYMVQNDMIEMMKDKIQCLQLLKNSQSYSNYQRYFRVTHKLLKFKTKLEQQYKDYCCEKTQSILGFFYGEIMNDYLQANLLFSVLALSDDKAKRIATNQDVFSNRIIYLITQFTENLHIQRASNDASGILHMNNEKLVGQQLSSFIPPGIAEQHDQLIQTFLKEGKSKFLRDINPTYLYHNYKQQMVSVELLFDISFVDEITFIAFLQPAASQRLAIILNNELQISCFSELMVQELQIDGYFCNLLGKSITKIIPNFPEKIHHQQMVESTEIFLEQYDEQTQSSSHPKVYQTSFQIQVKDTDFTYYILDFDFLKRQPFYFYSSLSNQSPSISPKKEYRNIPTLVLINDESTVHVPYQEENQINNGVSFSLNQLDFNGLDNSPSQFLMQPQTPQTPNIKLLSTLEYTNKRSTLKKNTCEQKYYSKPKIQSSSFGQGPNIELKDGQSSQISSLQGARNSKYYKRFEAIWKINQLNSFSKYHKLFFIMIVTGVGVQLLIQIIQLVQLNLHLISLASDIYLLQIKNFVYQPLETFLLTRWTIFNYILLRDAGNITKTEYTSLTQFPESNLNLGYDQLDINLKQVIDRLQLQDFLDSTYLNISEYLNTNVGENYNLSLRNSISILKNVQYTFKMAYEIDGGIIADSSYVYFQYRNYLPIKTQFSQLNELVLEDSILRSYSIELELQYISILSYSFLAVFFIFTIFYFIRLSRKLLKHFQIMHNISADFIDYEIQHLKRLSENITRDQNFLFRYQFHLENKETFFEHSVGSNCPKKRSFSKLQIINLHDLYYYFFFFSLIALAAGNITLTFFEGLNYLQKYPDTAKFYKAVSYVGTDVPTMFAQREILYSRATIIPYFTEYEYNQLLSEIVSALNRTQLFVSQDYNFDNFLVSESFKEFFLTIQNDNLCNDIPDELVNKSTEICPIVMNQNMQRGLQAILIYIINHITTDMEINLFKERSQATYLELEGAFLVSNIIKVINDKFNVDLYNQTQYYMNLISLHNITVLLILSFVIIFILTFIKKQLIQRFHLAQRFVYLLPSKTLILDTHFERNIRQLLLEY